MTQNIKLELFVNSYQYALNEKKDAAKRNETCSELTVGGNTPTMGSLKKGDASITI